MRLPLTTFLLATLVALTGCTSLDTAGVAAYSIKQTTEFINAESDRWNKTIKEMKAKGQGN